MAKGFAGAARLDERRRRRLATEGDSSTDSSSETAASELLPSKRGERRLLHRTTVADSATLASEPLPLSLIIPAAMWRHVVRAILAFGGAAVWLSLVHGEESIAAALQPATAQALKSIGRGGGQWYAAMLLAACAPLSLLIGWARSHSVRDFSGRYRVWTPVAGVWVLFSFCTSAGLAHPWTVWVNTFLPGDMPQRPFLVWFVPVAFVGLWAAFSVGREVWGNRTAFWILTTAGVFWLASALLSLKMPVVSEVPLQNLWEDFAAALGPVLLFIGLSLHARHVIHCNLDPAHASGWSRWIPRPHLWFRSMPRAADETEPAAGASRRPSRSRTTKRTTTRSGSATRSSRSAVSPASKRETLPQDEAEFLSDPSAEESPRQRQVLTTTSTGTTGLMKAAVGSSTTIPAHTSKTTSLGSAEKSTPPAASVSATTSHSSAAARVQSPVHQPDSTLRVNAPHLSTQRDEEETDSPQTESSGDWNDEASDRNQDLGGLSRKERKRLLREQRNRGHHDRR